MLAVVTYWATLAAMMAEVWHHGVALQSSPQPISLHLVFFYRVFFRRRAPTANAEGATTDAKGRPSEKKVRIHWPSRRHRRRRHAPR